MKHLRARELVLLTLPVVLIGGAALVKWQGLFGQFPEKLKSGPSRLVTSGAKPLALSPREVGEGFDWAGEVTVYQAGEWPPGLPANAKNNPPMNDTTAIDVFFERDGQWRKAPKPAPQKHRISYSKIDGKKYDAFHLRRTYRILLDLDGLEKADQIRLKGEWIVMNFYDKKSCATIAAAPGWSKKPINCSYDVTSPFDIQVKAANEPFPRATAQNIARFEVLDGALIRTGFEKEQSVHLRLRPLFSFSEREKVKVRVGQPILRDANGGEIDWQYDLPGGGYGIPFQGGPIPNWQVSQSLPADEIIVSVTAGYIAPKGGWAEVAMPMTLEGTLSDGESWPRPFKVEIPLFRDELDKFVGNPRSAK